MSANQKIQPGENESGGKLEFTIPAMDTILVFSHKNTPRFLRILLESHHCVLRHVISP